MPISLSPEEKLLISLCRLEFSEEKKVEIHGLLESVTDWESFFNASNNQGVVALVHFNLQKIGFSEFVPEQQRNKIHSGFLKNIARNSLITKIVGELDQIARNENIRIVLLKGLALEKTVYGDKGLRQMTDLDILVAPEDAMKLRRAMILKGFEASPFISSIYEKKLYYEGKHLPELKKYGIEVEIHIRLFDQNGNSLTEELLKRSYPSDIYKNLFYPDPQLHFLYLIKHLCRHEREEASQIRMYTDLALLPEFYNGILNNDLLRFAESGGCNEELKEKLNILNLFWNIPIPECMTGQISNSSAYNESVSFLKSEKSIGRTIRTLTYVEGIFNKALFITGFVFPSPGYLRYMYKGEKRLLCCYLKWWHSIFLRVRK